SAKFVFSDSCGGGTRERKKRTGSFDANRCGCQRAENQSQIANVMIGVIADDLSGAAEIGAVGLRHGLSAEIVVGGQPSGHADIVCVDTDSRSRTSEEAAQRVTAAARLLKDAGADWIYKKVDSVLRGHVVVEIDALMAALGVN